MGREKEIYTARGQSPLAFPVRTQQRKEGRKEGAPSSSYAAQQEENENGKGHRSQASMFYSTLFCNGG